MSVDLGGLIGGVSGIFTGLAGANIQNETQRELKKLAKDRPIYQPPSSIQEQVELLRQRSQQGLPGEALIEGQIQQNAARGVAASRESATSAADLLGATTNLYGQQTQSLTDLNIASARAQSQNQLDFAKSLGNLAEFEDKAFTFNEALPWQIEMNRLNAISQSAFDMTTGGASSSQSGFSDAFSGVELGGNDTTIKIE